MTADPIEGAVIWTALGLVAGSFATAASHRLPLGKPLAMDRSRCPACDHVLGAADLVPLFSWLAARGRCRYCGTPISGRYPLIELVTAALFLGAWLFAAPSHLSAALLALTALGLVVITAADLETGLIPDKALIAMIPLAAGWRWHTGGDWVDGLSGVALGAGVLYGVRAAFVKWRGVDALGLGDVKFVALVGLYVGAGGLAPFLLLSGLIGIAFGLIWRGLGRGAVFPFGPALCLALAIMLAAPDWFDAILPSGSL